MTNLTELLASLRNRLSQVLGVGLVVLIVTGDLVFALTQIWPAVQTHETLSADLAVVREALSPPAAKGEIEATLEAELASMQGVLDGQVGAFLSEPEVPTVLSHLYRYAEESGVEIMRVEAARATRADAEAGEAYATQSFQVEVTGPTLQLLDFITRLQEAARPTVVIDNLVVKSGPAAVSELTMNLLLYTAPAAGGAATAEPQP